MFHFQLFPRLTSACSKNIPIHLRRSLHGSALLYGTPSFCIRPAAAASRPNLFIPPTHSCLTHYSTDRNERRDGKSFATGSIRVPALIATFLIGAFGVRWYVNQNTDREEVVRSLKERWSSFFGASTLPDSAVIVHSDVVDSPATTSASSDSLVEQSSSSPSIADTAEAEDPFPTVAYKTESAAAFPTHVRYLVVGAGSAGFSAARAIRASDPLSRVLMITGGGTAEPGVAETEFVEPPPYLRPPLSKELWRRNRPRESRVLQSNGDIRQHSWLYYEAESFYLKPEELPTVEFGGVALLRGDPVVRVDANSHTVTLASGRHITYERCLLATGGKPKRLESLEVCPVTGRNFVESGQLSYFRTISDYRRLRDLAEKYRKTGGKIAILGGGFLASELAVSLLTEPIPSAADAATDAESTADTSKSSLLSVLHVFRESAPMGHVLPPSLASATARFEATKGAELRPSAEVVSISTVSLPMPNPTADSKKSDKVRFPSLQAVTATQCPLQRLRLRIRHGDRVEEVDVDHVVCAVGIEPNVDLAESAGLELDPKNGGFLVNAEMEAGAGIFAAGDAASYWDPVLGIRRRVEHLNFAEETGSLAGKNMAAPFVPPADEKQNADSTPRKPTRYNYQSSFWSVLGPDVSWDAVGNVDSRNLLTRAFFFDTSEPTTGKESEETGQSAMRIPSAALGRLTRGIVFYLTPKEKRLVGILLWNLPEEIYSHREYAAPSRLNLARDLLAKGLVIGRTSSNDPAVRQQSETEELRRLASHFDLAGEIDTEIKALAEQMLTDTSETTGELNEATEFAGQQ